MNALRCNCCGRLINPATLSPEHVYKLGLFELVTYRGKPAALRVGTRRAAVCAPCVGAIMAAHDRRLSGRGPALASAA